MYTHLPTSAPPLLCIPLPLLPLPPLLLLLPSLDHYCCVYRKLQANVIISNIIIIIVSVSITKSSPYSYYKLLCCHRKLQASDNNNRAPTRFPHLHCVYTSYTSLLLLLLLLLPLHYTYITWLHDMISRVLVLVRDCISFLSPRDCLSHDSVLTLCSVQRLSVTSPSHILFSISDTLGYPAHIIVPRSSPHATYYSLFSYQPAASYPHIIYPPCPPPPELSGVRERQPSSEGVRN